MAKSSRSSSTKNNNQRLKKQVFGPVEAARTERLSAKLLELAAQPKPDRPEKDKEMADVDEDTVANEKTASDGKAGDTMDIDSGAKTGSKRSTLGGRKKIEKRRVKKSSIVFPSYKDRKGIKKRR